MAGRSVSRAQFVNVVADLDRHDPNVPNPTDSAQQDGTLAGRIDPGAVEDTDPWQYAVTVDSWWTGWWPLLHLRFSRASPGGASLTVQVRVGLLPPDFAFEEVSFSSGQPQDPIADDGRRSQAVESLGSSFMTFPKETALTILTGWAAGKVCQLCQAGCQPYLLAIASALVTSYVLLYVTLLFLYASIVESMTNDPWVRLTAIMMGGITGLFGLSLGTFLWPAVGQQFAAKLPLIGKSFNGEKGITEWFFERTDASLLFIFIKLFLIAFTFAFALHSAGMAIFAVC